MSFLDDLYVVSSTARAHDAFQTVASNVEEMAGVRTHLGKLRVWSAGGGPAPPEIAKLGPDVWTADKEEALNGLRVLGTPLGRAAYVEQFSAARVAQEQLLLSEIEQLPDLQSAWLMLSMSAAPRANHMVRMLPPSKSGDYARNA